MDQNNDDAKGWREHAVDLLTVDKGQRVKGHLNLEDVDRDKLLAERGL